MLMTYLGTLKTWVWLPILRIFTPNAFSIRIPAVAAGTATVWLFFLLLRRTLGMRGALIGTALLATDPLYLLTCTFDWGPVALQHLLVIGGMYLLVVFHQGCGVAALAGGFLLFGLALWDKAIFIWSAIGLAAAVLAIYPRQTLRHLNSKNVSIAVAAFLIGCWPLVLYNARSRGATFHGNNGFTAGEFPGKLAYLRHTADGSALFGWLTADDGGAMPAHGFLERASLAVSDAARHPQADLTVWAFGAAVLLLPFLRSCRPMLFALIFITVTWIQMAVTVGAGGSAHHAILLWPFPQLFIAAALAQIPLRAAFAATAVLTAAGLLVINEYHAESVRQGPGANWTNAIFPLSKEMEKIEAREIRVIDWGILDSLRLLNHGTLPLRVGNDPLSNPSLTEREKNDILSWVSAENFVFVGHSEGQEAYPGVNARITALARDAGYAREDLAAAFDSRGRKIFEVFRFRRAAL